MEPIPRPVIIPARLTPSVVGSSRRDGRTEERVMILLPVAVPVLLLLLVLLLVVFVVLVELRILSYAYQKIGIRPRYVFGIMVLTLWGAT
jgi:hypothetical protein